MPAAAEEDELDDLYDYGAGMADLFAQVDTNMEPTRDATTTGAARREAVGATTNGHKKRKRGEGATDALGIDEEIQIKTRVPRVKLDEALYVQTTGALRGVSYLGTCMRINAYGRRHRLLSEKGIPKLRQKVKKSLRFRGKGHEVRDDPQPSNQ